MRLWSLHPKYLDSQGLVAVWREGLLAQKVILGKTRGYRHHPQLERFKKQADPLGYIGTYLHYIYLEATKRGYAFQDRKILKVKRLSKGKLIPVTSGQMRYELSHLNAKLKKRSPEFYKKMKSINVPKPHPLFYTIRGGIEDWEVRDGLGPSTNALL